MLVVIAGVQSCLGVLAAGAVIIAVVRDGAAGLSGGGPGLLVAEVVLWVLIAACLVAVWLGLRRRSPAARTPFLMIQLLVLLLAPLFWGSDVIWYRMLAVVLAGLGGSGLVFGLNPAVGKSLRPTNRHGLG